LGWEACGLARSFSLPGLTLQGVQDVLTAMGHPLDRLGIDVTKELFRLTEGDPLLIKLYVEALLPYGDQVAVIQPEELPSIQKGLEGYFDRGGTAAADVERITIKSIGQTTPTCCPVPRAVTLRHLATG
jgi:hypothetical protein